jgi:hypothetical protein
MGIMWCEVCGVKYEMLNESGGIETWGCPKCDPGFWPDKPKPRASIDPADNYSCLVKLKVMKMRLEGRLYVTY